MLHARHERSIEPARQPDDGGSAGDIVSTLLSATVDGDALSEAEFDLFFLLLAVAGNETTRGATTNGMLALIEHQTPCLVVSDPERSSRGRG